MKRNSHRKVGKLIRAVPCERPKCIPRTRVRGVRALGLSFERQLAKAIPGAKHGQWFEFEDENGIGYCQPDFLLTTQDSRVIILECKLSNVNAGESQLEDLYMPVVSKALKTPVGAIVVCRHVTRVADEGNIYSNLGIALVASRTKIPYLHYLGKGPL